MQRHTQEQLAVEINGFLRTGTTAMAGDVYQNPVTDYTDAQHLARETSELFRTYPIVVGHRSECSAPRDFFARDIGGVPVLVVRQHDGSIGAFLNVCRHRGSKVMIEACGQRSVFSCPYHAWSYRLDGSLVGVPNHDDFGEIDRAELGLVRLPVEERHGLIWVVLTPGGSIDVAGHLGEELDDELDGYGLDGFLVERSNTTSVAANWKVVVDGFLETYHLGVLHRTTIGPHIRSNLAPFRSFGRHGCMTAVRTSFDKVRDVEPARADLRPHLVNAYQIFPNTVLVWSGIHMEAWLSFPETNHPGRTDVTVKVLGAAEHLAQETDYWNRNWEIVTDTILGEDFTIGRGIQQGFSSGAQTHVRFGRNEPGVQHFHQALRAALEDADALSR